MTYNDPDLAEDRHPTPFDPDKIFSALEATSNALVDALEAKLKAEKALERTEDSAYAIAKAAGISIEDARRSARGDPLALKMYEEYVVAERAYKKALYRYDNLKILAELRRTQESSLRHLRV